MKISIQSQINQAEARIQQYKMSDLFSEEEKSKLVKIAEKELEILQLKAINEIEVINPEIVK
ncbi:hypothetical protein [Flavobacterium sp. HNIBRBA15423]|uniref:hypothetical protein n=1 Tax=Flavobacterium sp. HNIBRBA15423 TaxID=3458683 RepID=UPI0040442678